MDKDRELWWILWGIFTAFTIQVLYDGFGLFFGQSIQFEMGLVIEFVFFITLIIYAKRILKKKSETMNGNGKKEPWKATEKDIDSIELEDIR